MQKITFRKLAGEKYIYPELQGHFIEFLGSCIYDGIWVGEDSEIRIIMEPEKTLWMHFRSAPPVIRWPGRMLADVYTGGGIGPPGAAGRLHTMKTSVLSRRIPISSVHTR